MLVNGLFFLCGVMLVHQLVVLPGILLSIVLVFAGLALLIKKQYPLVYLLCGICWTVLFAHQQLSHQLDQQLEGKEWIVEGVIASLPIRYENRIRFDFHVLQSEKKLPDKIRLSWYWPDSEVKAGQLWKVTVKLKRPHGNFNPHVFDYEQWLFTQGIGATGYVRKKPVAEKIRDLENGYSLLRWRQQIYDRLQGVLQHSSYSGLISALSMGVRSQITESQWQVFRHTGTTHLIAISGLHIGLVAGMVFFVSRKLCVWSGLMIISPQQIAAVSAMLAAVFYAYLAGFLVPTQRALVMLTVVLLAMLWKKNVSSGRIFGMALCCILLLNPLTVLSASFWLSFSAVFLIMFVFSGRRVQLGVIHSTLKINLLTACGLAPLIMYYFQQVSLVSPLANLFAIPLLSLILIPLVLFGIIILFVIPPLADVVFNLVEDILDGLWYFLQFCAELPAASVETFQPDASAVVLAVAGVLLLFAPKGVPARYLGVILCLPVIFVQKNAITDKHVQLTLLDVGQGLATVIQTRQHTLVFDTGARFSKKFDMGERVVLPYLKAKNIQEIDTLLISHADNDHIGGAQKILNKMRVNKVISNAKEVIRHENIEPCLAGAQWHWDGVQFKILSPPVLEYFNNENDNSCVLQIVTPTTSILLTADIEIPAETWLLHEYGNALQSDVMIAPHHGSNTSSTHGLLEQVQPRVVLISSGYRNRYKFPHHAVIERYRQHDISWMNTAAHGAIRFDTEQATFESARESYGKYWHHQ